MSHESTQCKQTKRRKCFAQKSPKRSFITQYQAGNVYRPECIEAEVNGALKTAAKKSQNPGHAWARTCA